jgi:gas vesicle protein
MYRPEKGKEIREIEEEMKENGKRLENSNTPQTNAIRKLYLV